MRKRALAFAVVLAATSGASAQDQDDDEAAAPAGAAGGRTLQLGFAGLMDSANRTDLPPINLTAGQLNAGGDYALNSGGYYRIDIVSDGTQEIAVEGPELFRNVWINEIVINDLEVRPLGLRLDRVRRCGHGVDVVRRHHAGAIRAAHRGHDGRQPAGDLHHPMKAVLRGLAMIVARRQKIG